MREMREDDVRIASRETQKTEKLALSYACDWCKGFADRIESAWRREKAELCECLKYARRDLCKACRGLGFKCKKSEPCCTVMNIDIALHKALEGANAPVAEGGEK